MEEEIEHILVVDDDTRLRSLLRKYLMENGYRVTVAESAEAAKEYQRSIVFDLMILDRMMPGQDGLSFVRELRSVAPVPILMLTAMGEVKDRINGLEAGVDDYLPKPFEPRELLLRVQMILRRAHASSEAEEAPRQTYLGSFCFDLDRSLLTGPDGVVRLTSSEASLLTALALRPGERV